MKRIDLFFTAILVPLDFLTLAAAAAAAYAVRFHPAVESVFPVMFNLPFNEYVSVAVPLALVWIPVFALAGLYTTRPRRLAAELTRVVFACSTGIAAVLAIAFFSRELFDSRFIILAFWAFSILFIMAERILIRRVQRSLRVFGFGMKDVAIIGRTATGNLLAEFFHDHPRLGYRVAAQFNRFSKQTKKHLRELKDRDELDMVLLADSGAHPKDIRAIKTFSDNEQITFTYSAQMFPGSAVHPVIHTFAGHPVVEVPKTPLDGWGAIYKRVFDIIGAGVLIVISLPIQIITAVSLYIEQPGPVLFRHKRVGQRGKPFHYFKFRSMVKDAHKHRFDPKFLQEHGNMRDGTPLFKLEHDPRVTRVGRIIRKFSIDEIPEFYLVLIGRMSLVGPRPHMPKEVEQYKPHQQRVLTIKPGITGMAQTSGRADLCFNEEVQLDMHYIQNWSPWLDLVILLKTPLIVLFGDGAY